MLIPVSTCNFLSTVCIFLMARIIQYISVEVLLVIATITQPVLLPVIRDKKE